MAPRLAPENCCDTLLNRTALPLVVWTVSDNYQGGSLLGSAEVADGQEAEIVLTQ